VPRYVLGVALAVCFLVSFVASAPARMLALLLPEEQVLMQAFNGTVWSGSAGRCMVRTAAGYLHLGAVQWSLEPLSLLLFAPRLELSSAWGDQRLSGDLVLRGADGIDLHDFDAQLSAELVRQVVPVNLRGTLSAQLQSLLLRDNVPVAGSGRLVWRNAGWVSPQGVLPLGDYALDFDQPAGDPLQGQVLTLSGPVQASGEVTLVERSYSVDILVRTERALQPQLAQALSLIAAPDQGGYRLEVSGDI